MNALQNIRRSLHQIPEIGFQEVKTQAYLINYLAQLPQQFLEITTWRTGIVVKVAGTNPSKIIGWRTDMDGLPLTEETGVDFASTHEGFMHACGHDCHMTIALGLVTQLASEPAMQTVVVYFQPAEEGPGGAEPMLAWLTSERPDLLADELYALHIAPEYPVGTVATKPGLLFANTSELFIRLLGLGGHAAYPHKTRDMTIAAANLLLQLQTVISRNVDPMDSAVITIGKMSSGTVQNVIAEHAQLEGTIRTTNAETMQQVKKRIAAICAGIEASFECEISIDFGSMYHEVTNDETCARRLLDFAANYEGATAYECPAAMTGEDFGFFIKDLPGAMFWTGANCSYNLHHAKMNPDEALLLFNAVFVERFIRSL